MTVWQDEQAAADRIAIVFSRCEYSISGDHRWETGSGICLRCKTKWPYSADGENVDSTK